MAGDWIKVDHTLPDKPEVIRMAAELGLDQDAVCGKLIRIWIWADQNTISGNAVPVTSSFIDRHTAFPGFAAAMRKVAWLEGREGSLSFPRFDRHNGKPAKLRAETNRRVTKCREAHRLTNTDVTSDGNGNVTQTPLQKPLPEKRREEINTETTHAGEGLELSGPEFVAPKAFCVNPAVTAIEIDGGLIEYHEDASRWEAEFVRRWNLLPGVARRSSNSLDEPMRKSLQQRLMDPGWFWKRAMQSFPLPIDNDWVPNLTYFLKPDSVSKILDGSFQKVNKNGKRTGQAGLFGGGAADPTRVRTGKTSAAISAAMAQAAASRGTAGDS